MPKYHHYIYRELSIYWVSRQIVKFRTIFYFFNYIYNYFLKNQIVALVWCIVVYS